MKLKLNMWTAIYDIFEIIFAFFSWFLIMGAAFSDAGKDNASSMATFLAVVALIGLVLNVWSLVQSKKHQISIVGPILGIIGSGIFALGSIMAFPAMVLLIIACVFSFMQKPVKK
ncbi:transporter [Fructilactobacillus sp. Tb1]|uniref:transporter n=1 Tax=Fructilactobacillus sp. Tb1 TaxID=3422304 RepID=UPI003D2C1AD5